MLLKTGKATYENIDDKTLKSRAARYSKINLDIVLYCHNIQDNNRYNIYIQFLIQYQDCE